MSPDFRVLHRDLKPSNIGFLASGDVVIFDFGLAKRCNRQTGADDEVHKLSGMTGTLRYMAPEVALRQPYNYKADVFSFALILWQLCTLQLPFEGLSPSSYIADVAKNGKRPNVPPGWPAGLRLLMKECWKEDQNGRPDMAMILRSLKKTQEMLAVTKSASANECGNPKSRARHR